MFPDRLAVCQVHWLPSLTHNIVQQFHSGSTALCSDADLKIL